MARLNAHNEDFAVVDPVVERLQTRLDWSSPEFEWRWRTSTEILLEVGVERPTQSDAIKTAQTVRQKNGNKSRRSNGANLLFVPPLSRVYC